MANYTFAELLKLGEPQSRRDKAMTGRCVDGLGLYAAQIAEEGRHSSKTDDMRKLAADLIGYWGLDANPENGAKTSAELLQSFDDRVDEAATGGVVTGDIYQTAPNVINGLYRYCEEMAVSQGAESLGTILEVQDTMNAIAKDWDYEPDILADLNSRIKNEIRNIIDSSPLPGRAMFGEYNADYTITQAVLFNDNRGFALAHSETAPSPFVTWQFTYDKGDVDYHWGKYHGTEQDAKVDYIVRATDHKSEYRLREKYLPLDSERVARAKSAKTAKAVLESAITAQTATANTNVPVPYAAIPVQVLTESQPTVTITFSECDKLSGIEKMPLYLADTLFAETDAKHRADYRASGEGFPYHKTDFRIDYRVNGSTDSYSGRYDIGDGDGGLIKHIRDRANYYRNSEKHQQHLADQGEGRQVSDNAGYDFITGELVPFFQKHCELSQNEADATSELMGLYDAAGGQPSEDKAPRIAYLEAVVEHAWKCRAMLGDTALSNLPQAPEASAFTAARSDSPTDKNTAERDGKPSVLKEIRDSRSAPKAPAEPDTGKSKGKKKNQPEL